MVHNAAVTRSEFKAHQVYEQAKRYVSSRAYPKALKMLAEERVVIISGQPGVGKTTLADLLLYAHLEKGYQAVLIQRDIEEGERLFQTGVTQIFYFDDFMGATFFGDRPGVLTGTNDRALLNFIAMVRKSPTSRLILTTREHIYAQALDRSERLRHADLNDLRVVLNIPSYSRMQRARILYNHLYFSDLPDIYRDELLRDEFYLQIVKHEKFNPRLIEWLSSYRRLRAVPVDRYRGFIESLLRDPSEIWRHAYEQEITEAGRSLLLALRSLGGKCTSRALFAAFLALHPARAARYRFSMRPEDFRSGLREVANSFVKPAGARHFEVIDPSVLDLLNAVIRDGPDNAVDILVGAAGFDQVETVWTFAKLASGGLHTALQRDAARIAPTLMRLTVEDRRVDLGGGATGFRGPTLEHRLAIIVEMAEQLKSAEFAGLVAPAFARLMQEWRARRPNINDGVELLRTLEGAAMILSDQLETMRAQVKAAILNEASTGCRSDELRELISVIDTSDRERPDVIIARSSFKRYEQQHFREDLRECRSREQFDGLVDDLNLFRDQLGVDVTALLQQVEEAKLEFEEYENARDDDMHDEWRERYYSERDADRSVSEMFGSLRGDRD